MVRRDVHRLCSCAPLTSTLSTQRIPLERGRDIALQYGVANILAPLFDFIPNSSSLSALPTPMQAGSGKLAAGFFLYFSPYVLQVHQGITCHLLFPQHLLCLDLLSVY
jgi:hypothetical protein